MNLFKKIIINELPSTLADRPVCNFNSCFIETSFDEISSSSLSSNSISSSSSELSSVRPWLLTSTSLGVCFLPDFWLSSVSISIVLHLTDWSCLSEILVWHT
jgi:hypothetical protein